MCVSGAELLMRLENTIGIEARAELLKNMSNSELAAVLRWAEKPDRISDEIRSHAAARLILLSL